jgi:hypothetical protein
MPTKTDVAQIRMHFLLRHLPDAMRSDVLSDPDVAKTVGGVHRPIKLSSDLIISREELFATFRDLFDGEVRDHITALNGDRIEAEVSSEPDGTGAITVGHTRWRFTHADLLARDAERRMAAFERVAATHTLTAAEEETWRGKLRNEPLDDDSFIEFVAVLEATPESFARSLTETLNKREVSPRDLLPDDRSYWDRLIPAPRGSDTLADYVATELDARRRIWIAHDLHAGLRQSAREFAAPGLVPLHLLDSHAGDLSVALASPTELDDHFALVGFFEICARHIGVDGRLAPVGTRLLERLLCPIESLEARCAVFGAAFVIATARLATHEELRRRPVYWRRLAAAVHASLVVRTSGIEGVNHGNLLEWAINVAGGAFFLSCLLDRAVEPRWRPEWIANRHLMADAIGRVLNAWRGLDEATRPEEWRPVVEVGERWIEETGSGLATIFPAVLEGGLQRDNLDPRSLPSNLADIWQTFIGDPTVEHALGLAPFVFTWGVCDDLVTALRSALETDVGSHSPNEREIALIYGVHLAVERKDAALADAVAQASLQTALYSTDQHLVRKAVLTVIECTGAYPEGVGDDLLTERLERLARWGRTPFLPRELRSLVPELKRVRASLRTRLARALAALELDPSTD